MNKLAMISEVAAPNRRLRELASLLAPINRCYTGENEKVEGCGSSIPTKVMIKEKMRLFIQ